MKNRRRLTGLAALTLAGALAIGGWNGWFDASSGGAHAAEKGKPLFYRNPMNPAITSPVPAKDEMGMDYIPVFADAGENKGPAGTVSIDPVTVQNIGVRTTQVQRRSLHRSIRATGRITYDETRMARIHPKTEGWVEDQRVNAAGVLVEKGERLFSLYSPQLVATQKELLLALEAVERQRNAATDIADMARSLADSARERLRLLDVPEAVIRRLEEERQVSRTLPLLSPAQGVVLNVGVRDGQFVKPGAELYMLADLSRVWVHAEVYEYELPLVRVGDAVEMRLSAFPGRVFEGRVGFIYPYADDKSRTVRVRMEFDNPDMILKPDVFADIHIHAGDQPDALVIPTEAVVRSGSREQVFVVRGPGRFEPRPVRLGPANDGFTQVLEGLKEGETVVRSALFLIDSESKLREATAKMMDAAQGAIGASPVEDGMEMGGMSLDADMEMGGMSLDADMEMGGMSLDADMEMGGMSLSPEGPPSGHGGHQP